MPRGMIAAPPFMPPWGMGFPGGIPQMPPLPGGMPNMPGPPPQQPPAPQAPPQAPALESAQQSQPAPTPAPAYSQQPFAYQPQPYPYPTQPYLPQPYPAAAYQPQPYPAYAAPISPVAAAAAFDPVAAQQLAALQQAVQAMQPAPPQAKEPENHPTGPDVAQSTRLTPPPVSRVGRPDTYTTKGRGIQYTTRG